MSNHPTQQWLLILQPEAKASFDELPSSGKHLIWARLQQLLESSTPYLLPMVQMLKDKRFHRSRKFRAGDYRVLFTIEDNEITHQKHTYKGVLIIIAISNRRDAYND